MGSTGAHLGVAQSTTLGSAHTAVPWEVADFNVWQKIR